MNKNAVVPEYRGRLLRLFGPICLETFLATLTGTADTLMLSSEGDLAVGAVGTANSYINIIINLFIIASSGMTAVIAHYRGAGKEELGHKAFDLGLICNAALGGVLSLAMIFGSRAFLQLIGITGEIRQLSGDYMVIVGGACVLNALISIFSGYLRAFGQTKYPFYAALSANIVNVALNAYFLYIRHMGVTGVAIATVLSRLVNMLVLLMHSRRLYPKHRSRENTPYRQLLKESLSIGLPSASENIAYVFSVSLVVSIVNLLDPTGFAISARSYALQLSALTHCASLSFGNANGIMAGWLTGAGKPEDCTKCTRFATACSITAAVCTGGLLTALSPLFMPLFSSDPEMIRIVFFLILINIALEFGRSVNVCYGNALKATGDAKFTMVLSIVFTAVIAVGGTWFAGSVLGLHPAIACFSAMAADECARALCLIARWRTGIWQRLNKFKL